MNNQDYKGKGMISGMLVQVLTFGMAFVSGAIAMWWSISNADISTIVSVASSQAFIGFFLSCLIQNIQLKTVFFTRRIETEGAAVSSGPGGQPLRANDYPQHVGSCFIAVLVSFTVLWAIDNGNFLLLMLNALLSAHTLIGVHFYASMDNMDNGKVFNKVRNRLMWPAIYTMATPLYLGYVSFDLIFKSSGTSVPSLVTAQARSDGFIILGPYVLMIFFSYAICKMKDKTKTVSGNVENKLNNTYFIFGASFIIPAMLYIFYSFEWFRHFPRICLCLTISLILSVFDSMFLPKDIYPNKKMYTSSINIALLYAVILVPFLFSFSVLPFWLLFIFAAVWLVLLYCRSKLPKLKPRDALLWRTLVYALTFLLFSCSLIFEKLNNGWIAAVEPFFDDAGALLQSTWAIVGALGLGVIIAVLTFALKILSKLNNINPLRKIFESAYFGRSSYVAHESFEYPLSKWLLLVSVGSVIALTLIPKLVSYRNYITAVLSYILLFSIIIFHSIVKYVLELNETRKVENPDP